MKHRAKELCANQLSSVYIGGGTPSILSCSAIQKLFQTIRENFNICGDAEITFEANPDDITQELIDALVSEGVNRISLGVQSFNDHQLKLLRRRHSAQQAIHAVYLIHKAGIKHISIDLIYGQPLQTLKQWNNDLQQALHLPIDHLSAYTLTVEDATPLKLLLDNGTLILPSDETTFKQYKMLCETMRNHGFEHYEISNFCLPGCASRHNSGYWNNKPYWGIGPGAHSYNGTSRFSNPTDLGQYIVKGGLLERIKEELTDNERCNDFVFTSLRTSKGLNLRTLEQLFGKQKAENIKTWSAPHINNQHLVYSDNILRLTERGVFVSNDIMSDLMHLEEE